MCASPKRLKPALNGCASLLERVEVVLDEEFKLLLLYWFDETVVDSSLIALL